MSKARGGRRPGKRSPKPRAAKAGMGSRSSGKEPATTGADTASARIAALERELADERARAAELQEQQAATAEILRVISSSPADLRPVFQAIIESSVRLCGAQFGSVYRFDGERLHLVAYLNFEPEILQLVQRLYPMRPNREHV
jgi:two-component system, NtrC family, sensor kinase